MTIYRVVVGVRIDRECRRWDDAFARFQQLRLSNGPDSPFRVVKADSQKGEYKTVVTSR